ncbi:MAG TPA: DUF3343 domain-containing protein [Candidatus Cloacimonadota bacterium]|nr:DUF3343 domain-containing protein [Candidatus Cloacimonadota bacterium]HPM01719.1 DUF3343 domain-containing protein [Candidatus Cloacimonadota bacterium]
MKKIITFDSVHYTIKADSLIAPENISYQVVTVPKYISTDCGMGIEVKEENLPQICEILNQHGFKYQVFDKQ